MRLLGLNGPAGSGKDTAAAALVERGWTRVAFADPLKRIAYEINPLIGPSLRLQTVVDAMDWEYAKSFHPEVRAFLQRLGVAVRDHIGMDTWVNAGLQTAFKAGTDVVITDARFINEFDAIRDRGGHLVQISRPGCGNAAGIHAGHVSETQAVGYTFDHLFVNDGSVGHLHSQILDYVDEWSHGA